MRAEILRLALTGAGLAAMTESTGLSLGGVKYHLRELYQEHEVAGRPELIAKFAGHALPEREPPDLELAIRSLRHLAGKMLDENRALRQDIAALGGAMAATLLELRRTSAPGMPTNGRQDPMAAARHHETVAGMMREQAQAQQATDYLYRRAR